MNYFDTTAVILFVIGFATLLFNRNLIKKIIGFNIMDTAIYLFLAAQGYVEGRKAPIVVNGIQEMEAYINPIPSGLVLTQTAYHCPDPQPGIHGADLPYAQHLRSFHGH